MNMLPIICNDKVSLASVLEHGPWRLGESNCTGTQTHIFFLGGEVQSYRYCGFFDLLIYVPDADEYPSSAQTCI